MFLKYLKKKEKKLKLQNINYDKEKRSNLILKKKNKIQKIFYFKKETTKCEIKMTKLVQKQYFNLTNDTISMNDNLKSFYQTNNNNRKTYS